MSTTLRGRLASSVFPLLIALLANTTAHAGEVRVSVGTSGQFFVPYAVNINLGDHVTWVWVNGSHTVVNWSLPDDSVNFNFDGSIFNSDPLNLGQPSSTRFSWKSDRLGLVPYVCAVHDNNMSGRIFIHDPATDPVPVADFRISEVQYNVAGGADLIEITNYGAATGNLGGFRLAGSGAPTVELIGPTGAASNIIVPSGDRVVVHLNAAGTNTNTDNFIASYVAGTGLANTSGSLALYAPHTLAPGNALTNAAMILDFVQWGAGAQANEPTAVNAGFWGSSTFVPTMAAGHSIEYCANATLDHGMSRWAEVAVPNFGSDGGCLTPVRTETWGRLKTHYRP